MRNTSFQSALFACNANSVSGVGHVMRCIEYARSLQHAGIKVDFIGDIEIGWLQEYLKKLGVGLLEEPAEAYSLLILDSYDLSYLLEVIGKVEANLVIQLGDRNTPILDNVYLIWLDTNFQELKLETQERVILQGLPAFPTKRLSATKSLKTPAENVLVTLGGSPKDRDVESIVEVISKPDFNRVNFHIFTHSLSKKNLLFNVRFYALGHNLVEVAGYCDTAISGSGTSIWDFLSSKRHVGAVCLVDNQEANYRYVTHGKMAIGLGNFHLGEPLNMDALKSLLFNRNLRGQLIANLPEDLDGNGAARFTEKVFELLNQLPENQ